MHSSHGNTPVYLFITVYRGNRRFVLALVWLNLPLHAQQRKPRAPGNDTRTNTAAVNQGRCCKLQQMQNKSCENSSSNIHHTETKGLTRLNNPSTADILHMS